MSFVPPRCPNTGCPHHREPVGKFWVRKGSYQPRCRVTSIPRFRCKVCRRGFSSQTFRHDYRDRRPECNELLFLLLASGVGLRQSARVLELAAQSAQDKMRKIAATCASLHENLMTTLPSDRVYVMDEDETFEATSIRPLTVPIVIELETWFVVATAVGSIRRLAAEGTRRRRRQDREELDSGPRPDTSSRCVRSVLTKLGGTASGRVYLRTDKKTSYPTIARSVLGDRLSHQTTAGSDPRTAANPLFSVNTTIKMTNDNCGRLHKQSWLVTKKAACLQSHLGLFTAYRNYVRRRHNYDDVDDTPAKLLRLLPRRLLAGEVLGWRQDWGTCSSHPMSRSGQRSVA